MAKLHREFAKLQLAFWWSAGVILASVLRLDVLFRPY